MRWLRPLAETFALATRIGWLGILLGAVGVGAGCSVQPAPPASPYDLQMRAAFDLACPAAWVHIYRLDSRATGVEGCGRRLTYVESCSVMRNVERCTWVADAASAVERLRPSGGAAGPGAPACPNIALPDTRDGRPAGSPAPPAPAPPAAAPVTDPFEGRY